MEQLNEPLSNAIIQFIKDHPPKSLKRNLFSLFVEYVYTLKGGTPNDLDNILFDFKELFLLLDKIEDEIEKIKNSKGESTI
ncbi:hypothetical protein NAL32_16800 [Chryseobacterium sp. Ch-15]|uniref:Uncharacterized protein n=1 Tax=Chryseobacterium muglaense TaxID=2893752 RepID=A0A9Q3YPT9_9FLAO|nr:hypothetical protein [Chryseobacterium muglaense]MBD3906346.1 hypothetical protein [Chryseobacterium muglaense]MCC9033114.1 hypothetical protein [Chryseobacterium muglaense]MCM2556045.1 hypothetical protein [Chryseobacterium muglaense]